MDSIYIDKRRESRGEDIAYAAAIGFEHTIAVNDIVVTVYTYTPSFQEARAT